MNKVQKDIWNFTEGQDWSLYKETLSAMRKNYLKDKTPNKAVVKIRIELLEILEIKEIKMFLSTQFKLFMQSAII